MSNNLIYILKCFFNYWLLVLLIVGCVQNDVGSSVEEDEYDMSVSSYVSVRFVSLPDNKTRANPTGGENGDGFEKGQDYENSITSAVVFFFQGEKGINELESTPIKATVFFDSFSSADIDGEGYITEPQVINLGNGIYNVLVVANPDSYWLSETFRTLGEIRDHIQMVAWQESVTSDYVNFVMSSATDAKLTLSSNPVDDPALVTVQVERLAARLDYKADASYTCTDPAYPDATVEITGAVLVNNLTAGCFLTKRVASDVGGSNLSYLGEETVDANGVATNYVIDPWTSCKTSANNSFIINGEEKQAKDLYGIWFKDNQSDYEDPNWWADYVKPGTTVSDGTDLWQRIGYTLENVTSAEESGKRYNTGVVFKAKFHPKGMVGYTDGATFFAYGTRLYASMEDMMEEFYGDIFNNEFSEIKLCETWGDVKTFISSTLLDNDPSGYDKYLLRQTEGKADDESIAETDLDLLVWDKYMANECGYLKSPDGGVILDANGKITRIILKSYGVRTYEDATCYYTWWVRHSNDENEDAKGIMEYAVVRNNVYKLMVNSVYSLGGDVPDDENINVEIYVNDWLLLDPEILPM